MKLFQPLRQRQLSFLLSVYVGLVLNMPSLVRNGASDGWEDGASAVLAALAMVGFSYGLFSLLSLFGVLLYKGFASVVLLASAAASYYMSFFNVVIGYGVVVSTLTLDTDLSSESLGYKFILWLLCAGVAPVVALWAVPVADGVYSRRWRGLRPLVHGVLPLLGAVLVVVFSIKTITHINKEQAKTQNQYVASTSGIMAHSYLPTNWLSGLGTGVYQLVGEKVLAPKLFDPAQHFSYQPPASVDDLYVVFVIGETTRWDHMGMLGYSRDTTPQLAQEPNLVVMPGTSCDTATKLSLRCMFVRPGGTEDNAQRTLKERNVFSVLHSLGFSSELYAMQSEVWFYNSIGAKHYEVREALASTYANSNRPIDDMILVDELEKSLARNTQGKHLVILHTKGSHYLYSQRYTPEFARFTPECMDIDEACSKDELVNSFDNSVLYVDHMLKSTFDKLRGKNAIVFFTTDHGESINDDESFHATPKEMAPPEQFRSPFMVWASDRFLAQPPNQRAFAQLRSLKARGFKPDHTQLFDSILGCIGYTSADGGINAAHNWCSTSRKPVAAPKTVAHHPQGEPGKYASNTPSVPNAQAPTAPLSIAR